ncbi:MAG: DUF968 domain-containing protein [Clostridia bacterium]|nr:DUF968 domain-containing protein [Clostridia bacterium]
MEIVDGKIISVDPRGITIFAPYTNIQRLCLRKYDKVQVGLADGRRISPAQRRKAYALIGEIADWAGYSVEDAKKVLKDGFKQQTDGLKLVDFSLARTDMTTAREFITYLIDLIIKLDIPTKMHIIQYVEETDKYVYSCLLHKRCAICGRSPCDLHHVKRVGMGSNRRKIGHEGMLVMPLCREHHMECHAMAQAEFDARYHITGYYADDKICQVYGLKRGERVPDGDLQDM